MIKIDDIQESLLQTINIMINEKIKNLQFDYTKLGTIKTVFTDYCIVDIDGIEISCKVRNGLVVYKDDIVLINIPKNNFADRYIDCKLGEVSYGGSGVGGTYLSSDFDHNQLNSVGQIDITSTDTVKDKHISNSLAKTWNDHVNALAPHSGHASITHVGAGGTEHSLVTTTNHGFMSYDDKIKLNGIEAGATGDQTATEIRDLLVTVDGSGSGIDADLLDGKHAGDFASSTHTHDDRYYTETEVNNLLAGKLNISTYTANDVLTKLKTVDGSGSGVDADLLDGKESSSFVTSSISNLKFNISTITPSSPAIYDIWIDLN